MYAECLIEYPTKKIDKYFTYLVPFKLQNIIIKGMKVHLPFGNKIIQGFVINVKDKYEDNYELKEIIDIVDNELILNDELMDLGLYIKDKTLCPLITAYQAMLPTSLKISDKKTDYNFYKNYLSLNKTKEEVNKFLESYNKNNDQRRLLKDLLINDKVLKSNYNSYSVKALKEKQLIKEDKVLEYRINKENDHKLIKNVLNEEQQKAFDIITKTNNHEIFLLEGITGSGKTEVYLNVINEVIKKGKTAIMLVPEITLTMQIVNRFYEWFGSLVAIFHSALSNGEKYDEYLKILRGEAKVVVGTRSAIFAPLNNIGVIIIDEEHSDTYKQENIPKYNAKDIAIKRGIYHNCPVILGSATPTLEAKARALKGVYHHLRLTKRAGNATLPNVLIVDMMNEVKKKNFIFSDILKEKMQNNLDNNLQTIILLNRRGYSTIISCSLCGYTYKCPNCDITLTYHKSSNNLKCHYCGYTLKKDDHCPNCGEDALNYLGLGTEKVEMELQNIFPHARILRMDQDTTSKKGAHEKIIASFKKHEADILIGTQMISKGLDFPLVTLVGIINADTSLNIPDFRSNEKTFDLLYQASGRAGRGDIKGDVIIQTFNPDNYVLNCVKENDFNKFYQFEMANRHLLKYPPYFYLVSLKIVSNDYSIALDNANKVANYLKKKVAQESMILGPTTANIFKLNNNYRFQIVIKYRFDDALMAALEELDKIYLNENKVNLEIDIDPEHI